MRFIAISFVLSVLGVCLLVCISFIFDCCFDFSFVDDCQATEGLEHAWAALTAAAVGRPIHAGCAEGSPPGSPWLKETGPRGRPWLLATW